MRRVPNRIEGGQKALYARLGVASTRHLAAHARGRDVADDDERRWAAAIAWLGWTRGAPLTGFGASFDGRFGRQPCEA